MPGELLDTGLMSLPAASGTSVGSPIPRWRCVDVNSSGAVALCVISVAGVGVSQQPTTLAGQPVPFLIHGNGVSRVECGAGTIAIGSQVGIDASGRAIPWTTGAVLGRALRGSVAAGTIIEVITGVN
jgi:hypothetical protein